jgi:uncharacterized protein (TIGR01777 family)
MDDNISKNRVHVLITGGSGLIGRYLTSLLLENGYKVSHLSRNQDQFGRVRVFRWDPGKGILDPMVLEGVNYIIHLTGVKIGGKRWTEERRKVITGSRIDSARLLYKVISENNIPLKAFITASGINYYGTVTSDRIFMEDDQPGNDFLGNVCRLWEEAADTFRKEGIRTVKIRTGIVLEKDEGVLPRLFHPAKYGLFVIPGKGDQYIPWIHIKDLCHIYLKAIQDSSIEGVYNAVSPQHTAIRDFMRTMAEVMNQSYFHPRVPGIFLKILYGEMSSLIMEGSRISSSKIINAGYRFEFDNLHDALSDIIFRRFA